MKYPEERKAILSEVANVEQLENFLDVLQTQTTSILPEDPKGFVEFLSEIARHEVVAKLHESPGLLRADTLRQILEILLPMLEGLPKEKSKQLVDWIFQAANMLELSTVLLTHLRYQYGIPNGNTQQQDSLVTEERLEALTKHWFDSATAAFSSGSGWLSNEAGRAFFLLRDLDRTASREIVQRSLETDAEAQDRVVRILSAGSGGIGSEKGRYVHMHDENIEGLCDAGILKKVAVQRLADPGLREADLRAIYTSISTGSKEYFRDH